MASGRGQAAGAQSRADSAFSSVTLTEEASSPTECPIPPLRQRLKTLVQRQKVRRTVLEKLSPHLSHFLGYRQASPTTPHGPFPTFPFTLLGNLSLRYETCISATLGSFISILLIEAIMSTSTAFRNVYHSPSIITSFGASAVLIFGVIEAPLAQPRNVMVGQLVSAVLAICFTKLWVLGNPDYVEHLGNVGFYPPGFINGALCMSLALLAQMVLGAVHPPGGATALAAATDPVIVALSWCYIPVVLVSSAVMLGWALVINNLGRRRYPMYWWSLGERFLEAVEKEVKDLEEEGRDGDGRYGREFETVGEETA